MFTRVSYAVESEQCDLINTVGFCLAGANANHSPAISSCSPQKFAKEVDLTELRLAGSETPRIR
jgi:hypothetical protein